MTIVDPPSGWMYGFPAPLEDDYESQLRRAGYPVKDISFALTYSRYWNEENSDRPKEVRGQGTTPTTTNKSHCP